MRCKYSLKKLLWSLILLSLCRTLAVLLNSALSCSAIFVLCSEYPKYRQRTGMNWQPMEINWLKEDEFRSQDCLKTVPSIITLLINLKSERKAVVHFSQTYSAFSLFTHLPPNRVRCREGLPSGLWQSQLEGLAAAQLSSWRGCLPHTSQPVTSPCSWSAGLASPHCNRFYHLS